MIKVLGLALYGPLAASTRYRLVQYLPGLAALGIDLHISHLLGDEYLRRRFNGNTLPISILLRSGFDRLIQLWNQDEFDAVILHCELFPLLPGLLERALIRKPYIYDFDDAFYLKYRRGWNSLIGNLLENKFDRVIEGAAHVNGGNHVLTGYARQLNKNTQYLPTVVDTELYIPSPTKRGGNVFTIGWIGSPSTSTYLSELVEPLSAIGKEGPVRFIVIGGKSPSIPNVTVVELKWDESTELDLINSFDVGVMPLTNDDWARGKCSFKLIQYMACGVPVIASPVGANVEVVSGECGLLALTSEDWKDALRTFRDQPNLRKDMGQFGRERIVESYSLKNNLPLLASDIYKITGKS